MEEWAKNRLLDLEPVETPFGSIMNRLGLSRESLANFLAKRRNFQGQIVHNEPGWFENALVGMLPYETNALQSVMGLTSPMKGVKSGMMAPKNTALIDIENKIYDKGLDLSVRRRKFAKNEPREKYYNVVPKNYKEGEPIYSGYEYEQLTGKKIKNKWKNDWPDYKETNDFAQVPLFETFEEAYAFNKDFLGNKGKILEIVPDRELHNFNSEKYPVVDIVKPEWIKRQVSIEDYIKETIP